MENGSNEIETEDIKEDDDDDVETKYKLSKRYSDDSIHKHSNEEIMKMSMKIIESESYNNNLKRIENECNNIMSILKSCKAYSSPYTSYFNRPNKIYEPLGDISILIKTIMNKQNGFHLNIEECKQIERYINKLLTV